MKARIKFISKSIHFSIVLFSLLFISFLSGCDAVSSESDSLFSVKFYNGSNSVYSITNLQVQKMGHIENVQPSGIWSGNVLPSGTRIAPGDFIFLELDIPSGHHDIYRVGVDAGSGNEVMLHEQSGFDAWTEPTINHWGGDDRTSEITIGYNENTGLITIAGWSDHVGQD